MDDAVLLAWERELAAWKRLLAQQPGSPAMQDELAAASVELEVVRRQHETGAAVSGDRVWRHLQRLRALWDYLGDRPEAR